MLVRMNSKLAVQATRVMVRTTGTISMLALFLWQVRPIFSLGALKASRALGARA